LGFLAPMTGGRPDRQDRSSGSRCGWTSSNQFAGRKVEVIVEDTQGQPNIALTKLRKLVESDKVHVLAGGLFAHVGYALAPKVDEYKVPMLYPVMAADDLTQRKPAKWVVRNGWTSSQPSHPFGEYVFKTLGYKRVVTIGIDYAFGWEVIGGFQKTFEEAGGQVVQKLWAPLGTTDFAPYLSQIRKDADAVFALMVAASSLRFPKQYQDAGFKAKLPLIGGGTTFDEFVLPSLGDEAIGGITPLIYSAAIDTPANKRFVKEYRAKFGKVPPTTPSATRRAVDQRGGQGRRRQRGGPREVPGRARRGGDPRRAARARQDGRQREPHPEHLHPEGREEGWRAVEHGDPHLPRRLAVLEVQAGRVPQAARVRPELPAVQVLLAGREPA
jgi:branched-chain amino acid transport system substrate-binding protein